MEGYGDLVHADPVTAGSHTLYAHPYNTARNSGSGHIAAISGRRGSRPCRGQSRASGAISGDGKRDHSHARARRWKHMELSITAAIARILGNAARQRETLCAKGPARGRPSPPIPL